MAPPSASARALTDRANTGDSLASCCALAAMSDVCIGKGWWAGPSGLGLRPADKHADSYSLPRPYQLRRMPPACCRLASMQHHSAQPALHCTTPAGSCCAPTCLCAPLLGSEALHGVPGARQRAEGAARAGQAGTAVGAGVGAGRAGGAVGGAVTGRHPEIREGRSEGGQLKQKMELLMSGAACVHGCLTSNPVRMTLLAIYTLCCHTQPQCAP